MQKIVVLILILLCCDTVSFSVCVALKNNKSLERLWAFIVFCASVFPGNVVEYSFLW